MEAKCMPECCEYKNETKTDCSELIFHDITLDKKPLIDSYTKPWMLECSDLSFTNLFIWGMDGKMQYAEKDNVLFIKLHFSSVPMYLWAPIPKYDMEVDYKKAIKIACEHFKNQINGYYFNNKFNAEAYLKILSKKDYENKYWYFSLIGTDGKNYSSLIDCYVGEIIAKTNVI